MILGVTWLVICDAFCGEITLQSLITGLIIHNIGRKKVLVCRQLAVVSKHVAIIIVKDDFMVVKRIIIDPLIVEERIFQSIFITIVIYLNWLPYIRWGCVAGDIVTQDKFGIVVGKRDIRIC